MLCHYWELQSREWAGMSLPEGPWEMRLPPTTGESHDCWLYGDSSLLFPPFIPGRQGIIYKGPPSRPHLVTLYDMQGEGVYYYPDPPRVPFYIELRPAAGYIFVSFGNKNL